MNAPLARGVVVLGLERGDFLAHVREEVEVSRQRRPDILQPVDTLHRAVDVLGNAMRATVAGPLGEPPRPARAPDICAWKQACAELAALAVRLGTEGTPAFPATVGGGRS